MTPRSPRQRELEALERARMRLTNVVASQFKTTSTWAWVEFSDAIAAYKRAILRAEREKAPMGPHFRCPDCGPCGVDEDGCCRTCGRDAKPVLRAERARREKGK